eukprot:126432_1
MSHLKAVDRLRPFEKSLIRGYFKTNYAKYVPRDIFRLCLLFCFMLDEFSTIVPPNSKGVSIEGLNNAAIKMKYSSSSNPVITVIGRNIIKPNSGQYHWQLKVSNLSKNTGSIKIGWLDAHHPRSDVKPTITHPFSVASNTAHKNIFNFYFDTDCMETCTMHQHYQSSKITESFSNDASDYYFAIQFIGCTAHVQLLEYHESNWYCKQNNSGHMMDIGLANCTYDETLKIKYYRNALRMNPSVTQWHNCYLLHLNGVGEYDTAYAHAIKYKKGMDGISELAESLIENRDIAKALALLSLLTPQQLNRTQSNLRYGYCLKQLGDNTTAAHYMELHLNQLEDDDDDSEYADHEWCVLNTLQHLGWAYYHSSDFVNGLRVFKRLTHAQIVQYNIEGAFAHCLERDDPSAALKLYKLYQLKYPHNPWTYLRMAELYQHEDDADEEQKECLLKNIELNNDGEGKCHALWRFGEFLQDKEKDYVRAHEVYVKALDMTKNDDQRRGIYCSISINYHLVQEWEDAIKYGLEALKLKPNAPTLISNVAEYYFHAGQHQNSHKYFKKAMEYDALAPLTNGYFAMLLYEWKRYDEAMLYFEKYFEFLDGVRGDANNGMKSKCYQVFADIFWKKGNYEMSIEQCIHAIEDKDFETYKEKDQIYYLLSRSYSKVMDFKSALQYLQKAKQGNPNRKIYDNQIKILTDTMNPQFDLDASAVTAFDI